MLEDQNDGVSLTWGYHKAEERQSESVQPVYQKEGRQKEHVVLRARFWRGLGPLLTSLTLLHETHPDLPHPTRREMVYSLIDYLHRF